MHRKSIQGRKHIRNKDKRKGKGTAVALGLFSGKWGLLGRLKIISITVKFSVYHPRGSLHHYSTPLRKWVSPCFTLMETEAKRHVRLWSVGRSTCLTVTANSPFLPRKCLGPKEQSLVRWDAFHLEDLPWRDQHTLGTSCHEAMGKEMRPRGFEYWTVERGSGWFLKQRCLWQPVKRTVICTNQAVRLYTGHYSLVSKNALYKSGAHRRAPRVQESQS